MTDLCGDFMMFHCISTGQFTCWTQKQGGLEDDVPSVVGWVLGSSFGFSVVQLNWKVQLSLRAPSPSCFFFAKKNSWTPGPMIRKNLGYPWGWNNRKYPSISIYSKPFTVYLDPVPILYQLHNERTEILSKKMSKQKVIMRQTIRSYEWLGDRPTCQVSSNVFWSIGMPPNENGIGQCCMNQMQKSMDMCIFPSKILRGLWLRRLKRFHSTFHAFKNFRWIQVQPKWL